MTTIRATSQGYSLYNLDVKPTYPVDIVKMSYRQPNVELPNKNRIEELEDRVKELETLILNFQDMFTLTENKIETIRIEGCWQLKKQETS
jgi:hypothetical protein